MNTKATKFKTMLDKLKITAFQHEEVKDEFHSVIFRSNLEVKGQYFPLRIIVDDSIYTMIRVFVLPHAAMKNKTKTVLEYFEGLNQKYKVFKYYISEQNDVVLDCCIPAGDAQFDPEMIRVLLDVILNHLSEEYDNMVTIVSGKAKS
ncbi:MAG: histidine kinase [Megasphaera sp.]|nr:histidine kinase [Megasphaera sp.]MCH4188422.1 histidine kinase [Megasphaera sp.]MCH4218177.1 histidine kinase [Megasphaera sp.]